MTTQAETLTLTLERPPESRDGHRIGWSSSIDNLEKLFAVKHA